MTKTCGGTKLGSRATPGWDERLKASRKLALRAVICLTAFAALHCAGQEPQPGLEVDQPVFKFGRRDAGETVTNVFVLRNRGDADLIISGVRTSCGCTSYSLPQKKLPPGAETKLQVNLSLRGLQGEQRKTVTLVSNDATKPLFTLMLEGEAVAAVCLEPSFHTFGTLLPDRQPKSATVRLGGYLTNLMIVAVNSSNDAFPVTIAPDGRSLKLMPPRLTSFGAARASIAVELSDPGQRPLYLQVYAALEGPIRIIPQDLRLRALPGTPYLQQRMVLVRPALVKQFAVTEARLVGVEGKVEVRAQKNGTCQVLVQELRAKTLSDTAALLLTTDIPEHAEWRVPITAIK